MILRMFIKCKYNSLSSQYMGVYTCQRKKIKISFEKLTN